MLEFLYEDADILLVNKPAGLIVHKGDHPVQTTLVDQLKAYTGSLSTRGGENREGIVHRLDQDTEGVMIIAKTDTAHDHLKAQFKERQIQKKYVAICKGNLSADFKRLEQPIGRHPKRRQSMWVMPNGKPAHSEITVLKRFNTKTLVDVVIKTGRTHQIRVHLAYLGHPILGDKVYNKHYKQGQELLLQSSELGFTHPISKLHMLFKLPISKRLKEHL